MLNQMLVKKLIAWLGSTLKDLLAFPEAMRKEAGFQLHRLQCGPEAADWKPMVEIGMGVAEVRLRDSTGAWRVIFVARYREAVYVLHCLQKKTQRTARCDIAIAKDRFQSLLINRRREHGTDD